MLACLIAFGLVIAPDPPAARAGDLAAPPLVSIDPGCAYGVIEGSFDIAFTFRLRNFTPNAQVTVVFGTATPAQQQTVTAGAYGSVDAQLTFSFGATGDVPIQAFETANPAVTAATVLKVPCTPSLRLTPNCDAAADAAAPRPISIAVDGFNWDPFFGVVNVTLMQRSGEFPIPVSSTKQAIPSDQRSFNVVLDQSPSVTAVLPLMALPAGDYFVLATQATQPSVEVDFAVPCPQVVLNPTCGDSGGPLDIYDILLGGAGWEPFQQAQVIFDAAGQPQVFLLDVGASGQLLIRDVEEARIKPFRHPDGQYAVIVRQGTFDRLFREAAATFTVPCPPTPDLFIEPTCGPPQIAGDDPRTVSVRLTGVNLPASVLTVTVDPDSRGGTPAVFQFGVAGNLDVQIEFARRPVGQYQIVASADGQFPFTKNFAFDVPCNPREPRLRLRCDPEETNQPELAEVVLVARGFYEDAPLELSVSGLTTTVRTDGDGFYTQRMRAIDLPAGSFAASALQRDANGVIAEASTSLLLPCGTREPTLLISPPQASSGMVVTVRGFNFRANAQVTLRWSRGIGAGRSIEITADADGAFSRQVLIFHHDFWGIRDMTVVNSDDPLALNLSVPFVVAPGRGSPPVFGDPNSPNAPLIIRR